MDEMTLLRELRHDAPTDGPPAAVRERLLRGATPTSPRPSPRRRLVPGLALAAAAATVVALAVQAGPGAAPSAAAVLEEAADTVAVAQVSEPSPHQWVYESWQQAGPQGERPTQLGEYWTRFDGALGADHPSDGGELNVQRLRTRGPVPTPEEWYDALGSLPAEPGALLAELRRGELVQGTGATQAARDFDAVTRCLSDPRVMPADAHARLFRALATIPGVGIDDDAADDLLGRDVVSVTFEGRTDPATSLRNRAELLLDPATYAFRGYRVTALEDGTLSGGSSVSEGQVWYDGALVDSAVVDAAGQLP